MGYHEDLIRMMLDGEVKDKDTLQRAKIELCRRYALPKVPANSETLALVDSRDLAKVKEILRRKPVRTLSGVAVVAVMTSPAPCPHGKCIFCPGGVENGSPQSYTGKEPAARRGASYGFDPYEQVKGRIEQLEAIGHGTDKIDLIIMCCLLSGMASVLLIAYLSSSSVLDGHKRAGRRRSVCLILSVIPLMAALLYFTSPSLNVAIVLTLIALLLIAGHLLGGRAPLAGASMASIVLVWTILSEGVGSYGVLGSALLITGVMLAGSLMPVLLRRWSSQGARGRARARLVVAYLSHPLARLRSPLLTFSSIFVLLTVTTGLSGMVITETGKTVDQSSWALDSMAFRNGMEPFEMDLWDQVNRTQGALARENVSTMVPIFLEQASISLPPRLTAFGDTFDYAVYGLNKEALSMIDMPLSEFDQEMFSSPSEVWEQVLRGNDLAIIDSNLRYDLTISGQDDSGIRLGDVLCIHNAEGQSANVTVVGVTEQRLIGGVFVGPRLLTDFLGLSGPTLYLIDYAPGLSGMTPLRAA